MRKIKSFTVLCSMAVLQFLTCLIHLSAASGGIFLSHSELERSHPFASDPIFASVGSVRGYNADGSFGTASGVLIAPDWVLMSGHQVFTDPANARTNFEFRLGVDTNNPFLTRTASFAVTHPGWTGGGFGSQYGGIDLALIKLNAPVLEVPYAERFRGIDTSDIFNPTQYFMAGFGRPGLVGENWGPGDGLMRAGTNLLNRIRGWPPFGPPESRITLIVSSLEDAYDPLLDMEWAGSPGDSGGGWFQNVNGVYQLSGITSYGAIQPNSNAFTGAVRVSMFNDWIDSTITSVPEPSSVSLLFTGVGIYALVRRRIRRRISV